MAFLSQTEVEKLGLKSVGREVKLSDKASFHQVTAIEIGDNTRIDDFCILSAGRGGISIGRNVHLAAYTSLIGSGRIRLGDFANLSSRVSIYSSNDDYSGAFMTNPTVAPEFTNVKHAAVIIDRHAIIGAGVVVLPGIVIGEGACVGALSLVNHNCEDFVMYAGVPAKPIGSRRRDLLHYEQKLLASERT